MTGLAPTQIPPWQVSVWVQALPSVQGVPSAALSHSPAAEQVWQEAQVWPTADPFATHWPVAASQVWQIWHPPQSQAPQSMVTSHALVTRPHLPAQVWAADSA